MKKIILSLLLILIVFLFYFNRSSYIESYSWKSNSSNYISDFIEFSEETYKIKGKKIIGNKEKKGYIILCLHKYLIVTNSKNEICLYENIGKIR